MLQVTELVHEALPTDKTISSVVRQITNWTLKYYHWQSWFLLHCMRVYLIFHFVKGITDLESPTSKMSAGNSRVFWACVRASCTWSTASFEYVYTHDTNSVNCQTNTTLKRTANSQHLVIQLFCSFPPSKTAQLGFLCDSDTTTWRLTASNMLKNCTVKWWQP